MKNFIKIIFPVLLIIVTGLQVKAQYVGNSVANFNGTSSYITFNTSPEFNLSNGYTIEAWLIYQLVQCNMKMILLLEVYCVLQITLSGNISFSYNGSSTAMLDAFPQNKWTHIAATYDGTYAKVYIDGQELYTINSPGNLPTAGSAGAIGGYRINGTTYNLFKGQMNDVRFWTKAKSQFEINRDMHLSLANTTPTGAYSGLVLSYKFDVYGSQFADEGGFESNSGNNTDVTLIPYGNVVHQMSSYNSSLVLDGTTSYGVAPAFNKINSNTYLTAEAWFKLSNITPRDQFQMILSKGRPMNFSYSLFLEDDTLLNFAVNAVNIYVVKTTVENPFAWNHVAATYNAISGKMKIYLNGELAASLDNTPAQILSSNQDSLYIGAAYNRTEKFKGQLDEIRIWGSTERTEDEIKQYMHRSINHFNQPQFTNVGVYGFDGRVNDCSTEPLSYAFTSLRLYGNAYMRSSKQQSDLYSTSPVLWHSMQNMFDNTWNLSKPNIPMPASGVTIDSIYFATAGAVLDPKVLILMNTSNVHGVKVELVSPAGTTVQLTPNPAAVSPQPDLMTILGDNGTLAIVYEENSLAPFSPYFKPNTPLSQLNGEDRRGWWKLIVTSTNTGADGHIVKWGIQNSLLTSQTGSGEIGLNNYKLDQNYPNPFNPSTKIKFELPNDVTGLVKLGVYDITGKEVAVLVNGALKGGQHEYTWNAEGFASGVYYYTLQSKGGLITKKMLLVK